jgi:hypothetical protein
MTLAPFFGSVAASGTNNRITRYHVCSRFGEDAFYP